MKQKPYADIEKFQLLMYLFELAYDLAIAPGVNVLESPGFESFRSLVVSTWRSEIAVGQKVGRNPRSY